MNYECKICGKNHEIYFRISAGVSQTLEKIQKENPKRITEAETNLFLLDGNIAIFQGVIEIPTNYTSDFFYETWVECKITDFIDMTEKMGKNGIANLNGKLYVNLYPYFPEAKGTNCRIEFNLNDSIDQKAEILITQDSVIMDYQTNGIIKIQLENLMNKLHHAKHIN